MKFPDLAQKFSNDIAETGTIIDADEVQKMAHDPKSQGEQALISRSNDSRIKASFFI